MTLAKAITKTLDIDVEDVRIDLTSTIKSYDLTDTKFIFDIQSSQGLTINLMGGTAMYIVEYVHNSQTYAIQGNIDIINSTKISFNLPSDLKGYKGTVLIGLYVQMADGTKIDIKDIAVRIEPSIMDKGIDFSARTYFEDFETVKAEVTLKGEQAKASINAVVTDVNGYGNSQKQAINAVVTDVQTTGETAKNQINQVLPSVQSQVSELNRQINALPQIPDLFVAYADNASGGGFSKTDTSKLYKGYGVKNSNVASDYRWERNGDNLQIGGRNLLTKNILSNFTGRTLTYNSDGSITTTYYYQVEASVFNFNAKAGDTFTFSCKLKKESNFVGRVRIGIYHDGAWDSYYMGNLLTTSYKKFSKTITMENDGYIGLVIQNDNGSTTDGEKITFKELQLEIGNTATDWSPSPEDITLNSNPVNSILTTLSQENPSTTLGGTWVQLGNETKFNNTIYYWKRTR